MWQWQWQWQWQSVHPAPGECGAGYCHHDVVWKPFPPNDSCPFLCSAFRSWLLCRGVVVVHEAPMRQVWHGRGHRDHCCRSYGVCGIWRPSAASCQEDCGPSHIHTAQHVRTTHDRTAGSAVTAHESRSGHTAAASSAVSQVGEMGVKAQHRHKANYF